MIAATGKTQAAQHAEPESHSSSWLEVSGLPCEAPSSQPSVFTTDAPGCGVDACCASVTAITLAVHCATPTSRTKDAINRQRIIRGHRDLGYLYGIRLSITTTYNTPN